MAKNKRYSRLGFWTTFVGIFAITFVFLAAVDALPEPSSSSNESADTVQMVDEVPSNPENAVRIVAKSIGLDKPVVNPTVTDNDVLDQALTQGAVRYPLSAPLGIDGTTFILGHSSYLPIVRHQYYKLFDGIQNLKTNEIVSVYSDTTEYRYVVTGVRVVDSSATTANFVSPLPGKHLMLATCDSFGKKANRFVVTADFVGAYALASN